MDHNNAEFVGVDSLHAAIVTKDDATGYVAGTPEYLAPTAEIAGEAETNSTPTYYDNLPANHYVSEGATELTITVSGLSAELYAKYIGKKYDAATGRVYDSGEPNPPDVALSFRFNKGASGYRYYQFLKGKFTGGSEEAATKAEGNVDVRTYELTFHAVATTHRFTVDGDEIPLKRIFADTTDSAVDASSWFSQVQTPSTVSAPDPVALSTIVPADGADSVAVGSAIVLTFNNEIANENVLLIDTTDGSLVAGSKTWNAAGKILTFTPSSAMDASTDYAVIVSGVIDVYGQTLAATTKTFTTAA